MLTNNSFLALATAVPAAATKTNNALTLTAEVDRDSAGPLATAALAGWRRQPTPYTALGSAPSPQTKADLGALEAVQRQLQPSPPCPATCPDTQVGYCVGIPIGAINGGITCSGECCTGDRACEGFTGCVKKDGSCEGQDACFNAFAPSGIEDSCKGNLACHKMGWNAGSVGELRGSCIGDEACNYTGSTSGKVGAIEQSCTGVSACKNLAFPGSVGAMKGSCNGNVACENAFSAGGVGGVIDKSCNGEHSCENLARMNGKVETMVKSCHGYKACFQLAMFGVAGPITGSCLRDYSCHQLAFAGSSIQSITKTCNNDVHTPCRVLSNEQVGYAFHIGHMTKFTHTEVGKKHTKEEIGSIVKCTTQCANDSECSGIKWKDHSGMPCRFFGGDISENKCNGRNVCITV